MAKRLARAVALRQETDLSSALSAIARFTIVAGGAVALILAGPFLPF